MAATPIRHTPPRAMTWQAACTEAARRVGLEEHLLAVFLADPVAAKAFIAGLVRADACHRDLAWLAAFDPAAA